MLFLSIDSRAKTTPPCKPCHRTAGTGRSVVLACRRGARATTLVVLALTFLAPSVLADDLKESLLAAKSAVAANDPPALQEACLALARIGGRTAVDGLLELVPRAAGVDDALYWTLLSGVVAFRDRAALATLGQYLEKHNRKPIARDLLLVLSRNSSRDLATTLRAIALDGPEDLRLLAVRKIGRIVGHASVDALIAVLEGEEKGKPERPTALMWAATRGLTTITGKNFGPTSVNWKGWWAKNRKKPLRRAEDDDEVVRSTGTAVDYLVADPARNEIFLGLEKAPPQEVIVLSAEYTRKTQRDLNNDHMEEVLEQMGVPHMVVRREDFLKFDLSATSVILINCAQFHKFCICPDCRPGGAQNNRLFQCTGCNKHTTFSAKLGGPELKKLQKFVKGGGYLFCEDWTVKEVVGAAFPKFVAAGKKLRQGKVEVLPARGKGGHPYLHGIFEAPDDDDDALDPSEFLADDDDDDDESSSRTIVVGGDEDDPDLREPPEAIDIRHRWSIDDESYALVVSDRRRVVPLLTSKQLKEVADGNSAVAVAFRPGSPRHPKPGEPGPTAGAPGVVTVILSHFGKQETTADEHSLQNLLLNVLLDAYQSQPKKRQLLREKLKKEIAAKKKAERDAKRKRARDKKRSRSKDRDDSKSRSRSKDRDDRESKSKSKSRSKSKSKERKDDGA